MRQAVTPELVARAVEGITSSPPTAVVELVPRGTLRSFRCEGAQPMTLRVDEDPASRRVDVEALAFVALQTATDPPVVPVLRTRHLLNGRDGIERRFLAYDWIEGRTLDAPIPGRAADVGVMLAHLHGARVMDLQGRLPDGPMSLLDAYRKTGDDLRTWVARREADGLGHDLLTLSLSDLQRGLRAVVIADDNAFRTARRRVLCHGALDPSLIVAREKRGPLLPPLCLVGLDKAALGDAAFDVARFVVAADLDDDTEDLLLNSYLDTLAQLERRDPRFVGRYFAAKTLEVLARPIARLARMAEIKAGRLRSLDEAIVVLEREGDLVVKEIAQAMNALRDLSGRARDVSVAEVKGMGRVVAVEDLVLAGKHFRIAVTGEPYTGKTEVGAQLARRLNHRFIGTGALSRTLALFERRRRDRRNDPEATRNVHVDDTHPQSPRALVQAVFDAGFTMIPSDQPPFYRAVLQHEHDEDDDVVGVVGGEDITAIVSEREGELFVRAGALLDDDTIRAALRDEIEARFAGDGVVVEGLWAESLLGAQVQGFHLVGDAGVRRARLMAHRPDVEDEAAAATLLQRLDAASPSPSREAVAVDVGSRPAAAAALAVLVHLLPAGKKPPADLSSRVPL